MLIDAIVRQTTLLIAQLATSAGIRAPLANLADARERAGGERPATCQR